MTINIPIEGVYKNIELTIGSPIFIVGANGSGKSAMLHYVASTYIGAKQQIPNLKNRLKNLNINKQRNIIPAEGFEEAKEKLEFELERYIHVDSDIGCVWVPAHRISMLEADSVTMNRQLFEQYEAQADNQASQPTGRYRPRFRQQGRGGGFDAAIITLENLSNLHARRLRDKVAADESFDTEDKIDPLENVNEMLSNCNLTIRFTLNDNGELVGYHESPENPFSVAKCSDGERSIIYLLSSVLRAKPGDLILIDEPERHLHTAISSPLISELIHLRQDCRFVVSTHELSLASSDDRSKVIIVDHCEWGDQVPKSFSFRVLENTTCLPEDLKLAVLGGRKKVLFVEGENLGSLDIDLYQKLFPKIHIKAVGSCKQVTQSVRGLTQAYDEHHVEAFGLIDRDSRTDSQVESLKADNIYALNVCAVESLYYCEDSVREIIKIHCQTIEETDTEQKYRDTINAALQKLDIDAVKGDLAYHRVLGSIKLGLETSMPSKEGVISGDDIVANVDNDFQAAKDKLNSLILGKEWDTIATTYRIKSKVGEIIASKIGLGVTDGNRKTQYERMVRTRAGNSSEFADKLRGKLPGLTDKLR